WTTAISRVRDGIVHQIVDCFSIWVSNNRASRDFEVITQDPRFWISTHDKVTCKAWKLPCKLKWGEFRLFTLQQRQILFFRCCHNRRNLRRLQSVAVRDQKLISVFDDVIVRDDELRSNCVPRGAPNDD